MELFDDYGRYYRQHINASKSKFYTVSMPLSRKRAIAAITVLLKAASLSLIWAYLFKGRPKAIHLKPIFDRIVSKFEA